MRKEERGRKEGCVRRKEGGKKCGYAEHGEERVCVCVGGREGGREGVRKEERGRKEEGGLCVCVGRREGRSVVMLNMGRKEFVCVCWREE